MSAITRRHSRAMYLARRVNMLSRTLGEGPWLWATMGRLLSAGGMEPSQPPWYAEPGDVTALSIGYLREAGQSGAYNRSARRVPRIARRILDGNHGP